jgi:hypothetical protein
MPRLRLFDSNTYAWPVKLPILAGKEGRGGFEAEEIPQIIENAVEHSRAMAANTPEQEKLMTDLAAGNTRG